MTDKGMQAHTRVPGHWLSARLCLVFENHDSARIPLKKADRAKRRGQYRYFGASGAIDTIDDFLFDGSYLLVGEDGANLLARTKPIAFQAHGRFWVNNHAHILQPLGGAPLGFLEGYLNLIDLAPFVTGTAQPKLTQANLNKLVVPVAPVQEQQRIVDALDSYFSRLDDAIATLERIERNLKRYRASVLKAAVEGRLVPTEAALARAEGRDFEPASALLARVLVERRRRWETQAWEKEITKARKKAAKAARKAAGRPWKRGDAFEPGELEGIDEAGYARYLPKDDRWKAKYVEPAAPDVSELPVLPEGWCWATVEQLGFVASGQTPSGVTTMGRSNGDVPWFRVGDMNSPGNETQMAVSEHWLSAEEVQALGLHVRPPGTILFPKRGGAIRTNKKRLLAVPSAYDLNTMGIVPIEPVGSYLFVWFKSLDLGALADGSNVPQLNHGDIAPLPVPFPPEMEQRHISAEVDRLSSLAIGATAIASTNLKRCKRLRQSILKWAFEGKLADQDPNDEPAAALLARIKAERAAAEPTRKRRKKKDPR